jgi:hypothetical protein
VHLNKAEVRFHWSSVTSIPSSKCRPPRGLPLPERRRRSERRRARSPPWRRSVDPSRYHFPPSLSLALGPWSPLSSRSGSAHLTSSPRVPDLRPRRRRRPRLGFRLRTTTRKALSLAPPLSCSVFVQLSPRTCAATSGTA